MRGKAPLLALGARTVVVDECHFMKNPTAHRSRAVRRLARRAAQAGAAGTGGTFVALSGTPITHHPADLWPTLEALAPGAWPARERWVNRYCQVVPGDYSDDILGLHPHTEPEFRLAITRLHHFIVEMAGSNTLTMISAMLHGVVEQHMSRYVARKSASANPAESHPRRTQAAIRSFRKLANLLEAHEVDAAEAHWREHLRNANAAWLLGYDETALVDVLD